MKKFSIEFKWAAIATLFALIWMFIVKALGFHDIEKIRFVVGLDLLFNLVLILFYYACLRQKKNDYFHGVATWQQIFLSGLVLCVMITFFFPLIQYITYNQVSPYFIDTLYEALATQTKMGIEEAQKNASFDLFLRNGVTNNLSFGVVTVAILAYFLKTKDGSELKKSASSKAEVVKVKRRKNKTINRF